MGTKTFQLSTLSAAIASAMMTGYTGPALAQGPALEEVIVTATRRSASVQDIPINITALSSDLIARERLQDLSDIARRVPGMNVIDQGSRAADVITVRGLSVESVSPTDGDNTGGETVGTYVGEIPFYVDLRLNDMERVEVLIGPQGTLYGAGTLAGAVRYIPNRPQTDEFSVQVRGDVYDLEESSGLGYEAGGTINVPLIENTLALRASVDYYDDPGFIDYNFLVRQPGISNPQPNFNNPADVAANLTQKNDVNTDETLSGRIGLRYTGDSLDANLTYYYQDSESGGRQINHQAAFGTEKYEAAHRFLEPLERENDLLALELVADLGFAELTSATGYSTYEEDGQRDQTDLLLALDYGYEFFPSFVGFARDTAEEDTFTQELRLVSTGDGPLSWIVGGFYSHFNLDSLSQEFTPGYDQFLVDDGAGDLLRPDSLEYYFLLEQEITEVAVFGEIAYQITDAWQVTVGARWFDFEDDADSFLAFPLLDTVFGGVPADQILPTTETSFKVEDDDFLFKFNTSYEINDDMMGYFTVSEGYRLGGVNQIGPCPDPVDVQVCGLPNELTYTSDTTVNYELGLRSQWGNSVIFNAAVYYIDWEDTQLDAPSLIGAQPITANAGSASSTGIELAGSWLVTPDFTLTASYSYTKAELTDDAPCLYAGGLDYLDANGQADLAACLEDPLDLQASAYDGDRLPGSPEHQGFIAANYGIDLAAGSRVELDWSVTTSSDILTKAGERNFGESLDGYTLHNASVNWLQDGIRLSLYVDNVLNEFAETGVRTDRSFIRQQGDFDLRRYFNDVLRPRQVGLRFVYDFGS